jgi:hypothetical protein
MFGLSARDLLATGVTIDVTEDAVDVDERAHAVTNAPTP